MEDEIDLKEILSLFWSKKIFILIMLIAFTAAGFIYTNFFVKPEYTARASMILAAKNSGTGGAATVTTTDVTLNDKLIDTYKILATSNAVVREVIKNLNFSDISENDLKNEINISAVTNTQMLYVSVTNSNPERAAKITNELTKVFSKKVAEVYKIDNISVIDEAEVPTSPSNIDTKKTIMIFAVAGLVISIGAVLLMNMLDNTVSNSKDIEKALGVPVLAELPLCDFGKKKI